MICQSELYSDRSNKNNISVIFPAYQSVHSIQNNVCVSIGTFKIGIYSRYTIALVFLIAILQRNMRLADFNLSAVRTMIDLLKA